MKKQTAVEWLMTKMDVLDRHSNKSISVCATKELWLELYNQAKAMEKEQIFKAFNQGTFANDEKVDAEQYYNETYNTDTQ